MRPLSIMESCSQIMLLFLLQNVQFDPNRLYSLLPFVSNSAIGSAAPPQQNKASFIYMENL